MASELFKHTLEARELGIDWDEITPVLKIKDKETKMSEIKNLVKDRLAQKLKNQAPKSFEGQTTELKVEPEPEFMEETFCAETAPEGTKMYSKLFSYPEIGSRDFPIPVFKDSDWDLEDLDFIPKIDSFFVWDHSVLYPFMLAYVQNAKTLIVGPTGSGKTSLVKNVCAVLNQPYLRVNGRSDMESDTLLGKPWVNNGSMEWIDGELPKAMSKGWMVAFDEPWKTPSGIQMALQRFYERDGILQIDDKPGNLKDKQIQAHSRFRITLCDNVIGTGDNSLHYGATLIQDQSTLNRLDIVLHLGYLNREDEVKRITNKFKAIPESKAKQIVQLANLIRTNFDQGELSVTISPRNIDSWCEFAGLVRSYEESFKHVMLNRYAEESEQSSVKQMFKTVFGSSL